MSADNWRNCPKCGAKNKLREDYEIYSEDDTIRVTYRCSCRLCKYTFSFDLDKKFDLKNGTSTIKER